jgi:CxxC-x17-CxxC domain-containing protein
MDFQDRAIQCLDCNSDFTFTAGEQEFYDRKGFREVPKRCKECRGARKTRRTTGPASDTHVAYDSHANSHSTLSGHAHVVEDRGIRRTPREMFEAVCATCGAPARVPFRPASGRPVYCKECYSSRQGQGSGYGGGY